MNLISLCNEKTTLLKMNGEKHEKRAYVANNKILIRDTSVPIEKGDQIIRNLPNGITEVYKVIESIFFNRRVGGTQPFYNLNVRKVSESDKELKLNGNLGHIIHITGNNSHVNINSKDNSINIDMNSINYENVFNELKKYIINNTDNEIKEVLMSSVNDLEDTKGTSRYTKALKSFIQVAKDCALIVTPFIPVLNEYLK